MKKNSKRYSSFTTWMLFALAICLLSVSTVASARAALTHQSALIKSEFSTQKAGIAVHGGSVTLSGDQLLTHIVGTKADGKVKKIIPGKLYDTDIAVTNSGNIDEYVRVVIRKSWVDKNGDTTTLDPEMIKLGTPSGWYRDTANCTDECEVFIYTGGALASGSSLSVLSFLQVDEQVSKIVKQEPISNGHTTIFLYDGAQVCLEVEADGVQTHNAADAIKSAWGLTVSVGSEGGPIQIGWGGDGT